MANEIEHNVFKAQRDAVATPFNGMGVYAMGTYLNLDQDALEKEIALLTPTPNTIRMMDYLKDQQGNYAAVFNANAKSFTFNAQSNRAMLEAQYQQRFTITAVGAELLGWYGNGQSNHSIELTEAIDEAGTVYYVFAGAGATVEAKSDEFYNAPDLPYQNTIFSVTEEGGAAYNERALFDFILTLANDDFGRHFTLADVDGYLKTQEANSHFLRPTDEDVFLDQPDNQISRLVTVIKMK